MRDESKFVLWGMSLPILILALIAACAVFSSAAFIITSKIDNAAVQPQIRQNEDQNANYRRSVEAQFQNAYALYNSEVAAVQLDKNNLSAFVAQNGDPKTYPAYSQVDNEYQQLFQAWTQDEQGLVNAVNGYNALCSNADTGPYRPTNLPTSLSVPNATPAP